MTVTNEEKIILSQLQDQYNTMYFKTGKLVELFKESSQTLSMRKLPKSSHTYHSLSKKSCN